MRSGLIARKIGMTRIFSKDGIDTPVTVLKLDNVQVVSLLTKDKNGYFALQVGAGDAKTKNISKSLRGHFAKNKISPKKIINEFIVSENMMLKPGDIFSAEHFVVGQKIDVVGTSKGKGFSGAMKRHNFSGLRASHGVSISHRSHGSTGNSQDPGKVWKGKKMAGQYGNVRKTVQGLTVVDHKVDEDLIFVKGSIPGPKNSYLILKDSVKHSLPNNVLSPAGLKKEKSLDKSEKIEESKDLSENIDNKNLQGESKVDIQNNENIPKENISIDKQKSEDKD